MVHEVPYNPWQDIIMHQYEPPGHHHLAAHSPLEQDDLVCVEIHGSHQVWVERKSLPKMSFTLTEGILFMLQQQPVIPKVLLADLHDDAFVQVLHSLTNSQVQVLDIANCSLTTGGNPLTFLDAFPALTQLNMYSCHIRDYHISILLHHAPLLQHISLYLVEGTLDLIFQNVALSQLRSIDFKGRFASLQSGCFCSLPRLQHVTLVGTLGSCLRLGHVLSPFLTELVLGKTVAEDAQDILMLASLLTSPGCRLRKLHLLGQVSSSAMLQDGGMLNRHLLEAIRCNKSLVDLVWGSLTTATTTCSNMTDDENVEKNHDDGSSCITKGEIHCIMMRNQYLTHGLGKMADLRMLPWYLENVQRQPRSSSPLQAIHFMIRQRPDLFRRHA